MGGACWGPKAEGRGLVGGVVKVESGAQAARLAKAGGGAIEGVASAGRGLVGGVYSATATMIGGEGVPGRCGRSQLGVREGRRRRESPELRSV